jgi:hypothetical protein
MLELGQAQVSLTGVANAAGARDGAVAAAQSAADLADALVDRNPQDTEEVWTSCTAADFRKHKPRAGSSGRAVAAEADQEAVAILVDSVMELVARKETS